MAALAGAEGVILILAAAVIGWQTGTVADLQTVVRDLPRWCARAEQSSENLTTAEGQHVLLQKSAMACGLMIQPWTGDDGALARTIETTVASEADGWYAVRVRERVVNESGPMRWTEYEHQLGGFVRLIEPDEGQSGTLTLDLLGGD